MFWGQHMKDGAHPSPFAALSFPDSKKIPIYFWVDRVFQSLADSRQDSNQGPSAA